MIYLHRKAGLSREQFQYYWQNNHGPFFMKNAAVMWYKKYVQSHTIDSPLNDGMQQSRGMPAAFDGGVQQCQGFVGSLATRQAQEKTAPGWSRFRVGLVALAV
ncbi:MAG: EthD domain-containing protein [Planctomycetota bacterium]